MNKTILFFFALFLIFAPLRSLEKSNQLKKEEAEIEKLKVRNGIRIFLINNKKELLLINSYDDKTFKEDGTPFGNFWFTPGGGLEPGETWIEAAIREIEEETGIEKKHIVFGDVIGFCEFNLKRPAGMVHFNQRFIIAYTDKTDIKMAHLSEHEKETIKKIEWLTAEQILAIQDDVYPVTLKENIVNILNGTVGPQQVDFIG